MSVKIYWRTHTFKLKCAITKLKTNVYLVVLVWYPTYYIPYIIQEPAGLECLEFAITPGRVSSGHHNRLHRLERNTHRDGIPIRTGNGQIRTIHITGITFKIQRWKTRTGENQIPEDRWENKCPAFSNATWEIMDTEEHLLGHLWAIRTG